MSTSKYARCPNPDVYMRRAARKHLDRNTGREDSVICSSDYSDPRLYVHGVLPMQDLDAQEHIEPGMPIFVRKWKKMEMFQSAVGGNLRNSVRASELKQGINRDWINYDKGTKNAKTMQTRIESWTKTRPAVVYQHGVGFPKAPCFDPAPYNETGFPHNPRLMSTSSAIKAGFANRRTFKQPFNPPNEMQHAVGLGGHEEDSYHTKSMHGFGDTKAVVPYIEFMKEDPKPSGVKVHKPDFATAIIPPPRFLQTMNIMSPRKRRELIAKHDEDGDGQMDSEELAEAPTHVRQFMSKNKIGPAMPATKHLPRGARTFQTVGPMLTPRRTHTLAHDSHEFDEYEARQWCANLGSKAERSLARTMPMPAPPPMSQSESGAFTARSFGDTADLGVSPASTLPLAETPVLGDLPTPHAPHTAR